MSTGANGSNRYLFIVTGFDQEPDRTAAPLVLANNRLPRHTQAPVSARDVVRKAIRAARAHKILVEDMVRALNAVVR